jgi:hypothetical protein
MKVYYHVSCDTVLHAGWEGTCCLLRLKTFEDCDLYRNTQDFHMRPFHLCIWTISRCYKHNTKDHISTFAIFLIVGLETFDAEFVGMCTIYLCIKIYMLNSNDSLIISIKSIAKYGFSVATILLFYVLQQKYLNRNCIFFKDLFWYISSGAQWH